LAVVYGGPCTGFTTSTAAATIAADRIVAVADVATRNIPPSNNIPSNNIPTNNRTTAADSSIVRGTIGTANGSIAAVATAAKKRGSGYLLQRPRLAASLRGRVVP
jgi:hypothetical protein